MRDNSENYFEFEIIVHKNFVKSNIFVYVYCIPVRKCNVLK